MPLGVIMCLCATSFFSIIRIIASKYIIKSKMFKVIAFNAYNSLSHK